jgi:hypothetical protein
MKKALISKLVTVIVALLVAIDGNWQLPYQNAALSSGERAKDLMSD